LHLVLAAAELDDLDLVGAAVADDLRGHARALEGVTDLDPVAVAQQQDVVELDLGAGLGLELLDAELLALRHAVLLTAGYQNCVHDQAFLCCYCGQPCPRMGGQKRNCRGPARPGSSHPMDLNGGPGPPPGGLRARPVAPKSGVPLRWRIASAEPPLMDAIKIRGARTHNLKNIDVDLPRDKLIVITGLSGSGKSSLAFDTIYAEGQRRYVESLSAYALQFLTSMEKQDVDHFECHATAILI